MQLFLAFDTEYKQHSEASPIRAWCLLNNQGVVEQSGAEIPLTEVSEKIRGLSVVIHVFIISPDVVVMQVPRPAGSFSKIKQAIPYLLEEQLAEDVETLHFSILNPHDTAHLSVAVVARAVMKECMDLLLSSNLVPQTLIPLWLALPTAAEASHWVVLVSSEYAWVRSGDFSGFSLERNYLITLLETLPEAQLPKQIHWVTSESISMELEQCKNRNIKTAQEKLKSRKKANWLEYAAQQFKPSPGINLLQGEFNVKQQTGAEKRWRVLAQKLFVAIFAVWFTGLMGQYLFLRWEHHHLQSQIEDIYFQTFPKATSFSSPRTIFEREIARVASGRAGTDFLSLLLRAGDVIVQYPQIQITNISYESNQLSISMLTDNFSRLQELDKKMQEVGLTVEQENASSSGGTVNAHWKIS